MVFDLRPPLGSSGVDFSMVFQYFCLEACSGLHFAMFFNTFAQNPSQGFLVYMISKLYSMFLWFFSAFATSILPWPWASVLFAGSFLISHGFDLYYLILYGSRFFLGQGKASISHSSFRWTCWMYLQLLRVNIFSVCSGVARFRSFVVALFVDLFVQSSPWGFIRQGSQHRVAQSPALAYILDQLPVWSFKGS